MTFRTALDEHLAALRAKDVERFAATLGDDVFVIDGRGERKRGTDTVLESHADWFAIAGWTFDYDVLFTREFRGAALALIAATYRPTPHENPHRFLLTLVFEGSSDDGWKFVYDQNTPLPAPPD